MPLVFCSACFAHDEDDADDYDKSDHVGVTPNTPGRTLSLGADSRQKSHQGRDIQCPGLKVIMPGPGTGVLFLLTMQNSIDFLKEWLPDLELDLLCQFSLCCIIHFSYQEID